MHYINQCLEPGRILNYKDDILKKSSCINDNESYPNSKQAGMIELQLTDKCNLNCFHCHFRNQGDVFFREEWLKIITDEVQPKAISLAGGGEPTLYPDFSEAIRLLKNGKSNPDIGLITNGVIIPDGDWVNLISWLRVSLYSIIDGYYAGKNPIAQKLVMKNIFKYMQMEELKMLGVSLLYYNDNIVDCIKLSYDIFELLKSSGRSYERFNLQFKRAFILSDPRNMTIKTHSENLKLLPSVKEIRLAIAYKKMFAKNNHEFARFLDMCSNYSQIEKMLYGGLDWAIEQTDSKAKSPDNFKACYTVLENRLITPDGYVYACPTIAENRDNSFAIAHITDSEEIFYENVIKFYNCQSKWCNKRFCRHTSHNEIVRKYIEQGILPVYDQAILEDNFF